MSRFIKWLFISGIAGCMCLFYLELFAQGICKECLINFDNDSLLQMAAQKDAEENSNTFFSKYYLSQEIYSHAIHDSKRIAEKHFHLKLIYTPTLCQYQDAYNRYFDELYYNKNGISVADRLPEILTEGQIRKNNRIRTTVIITARTLQVILLLMQSKQGSPQAPTSKSYTYKRR